MQQNKVLNDVYIYTECRLCRTIPESAKSCTITTYSTVTAGKLDCVRTRSPTAEGLEIADSPLTTKIAIQCLAGGADD